MSPSNLKIILADDDRDDCFLFNEAIDELSLSVDLTIVHDGEQLMSRLKKTNMELPHALFLDLNMPRKNGFEVLKEIKSDENLDHFPVIIFSTSFDQQVANRLYKDGAHYYICKPSDFSTLKNVIQRALNYVAEASVAQPPREQFVLTK